jgi:CRP/FNR family transcriptional regulator
MERNRVGFLHRCAGLGGLAPDEIERVSARTTVARIGRRGRVWSPGAVAERVVWVRSGVLREQIVESGRSVLIGLTGRGGVVGADLAFAYVNGATPKRRTLVEAHEETVAYAIKAHDLAELVREIPALAVGLGAVEVERRRRLEQRLPVLLRGPAASRLAHVLLELSDTFGVRDSRGVILNLRLTHRDLASLVGINRETASFAILELRAEGLVQSEGKRLVLLDPEALAARASGG